MRKKALLLQLRDYIEANAALEAENTLLRKELAELELRQSQPEAVETDASASALNCSVVTEEGPVEETKISADMPALESEEESITEGYKTEDGTISVAELDGVEADPETEYAAGAIGEVVMLCTAVCASLAELGTDTARESINLALGRAEVFKADCLTVVSSEAEAELKREYVDKIKKAALDYICGLAPEKESRE